MDLVQESKYNGMTKRSIWIIAIVLTVLMAVLLIVQVVQMRATSERIETEFAENVNKSLFQIVSMLEEREVARYLNATADDFVRQAKGDEVENMNFLTPGDTLDLSETLLAPKINMSEGKSDESSFAETSDEVYDQYRRRFYKSKTLLDQVALRWMTELAGLPINERIRFEDLDELMCRVMDNNGLHYPMHYVIEDKEGQVYYERATAGDSAQTFLDEIPEAKKGNPKYKIRMFMSEGNGRPYYLVVSFYKKQSFMEQAWHLLLPSMLITAIIFFLFLVALVLIFRQTNLNEMKNNFINNMTHELKTPIASISLASQMLNDPSVSKSESMVSRLSHTIGEETERLRLLVEKVLQTTLYATEARKLHFDEVNANELVKKCAGTFMLNVQDKDGQINLELDADNAWIEADKIHFTNVVYNLMENALKYRRAEVPFVMTVATHNDAEGNLLVSVQDNGIGIKKEYLKHIFERFYRVPTGNVHDVKGFGLGLTYVDAIVRAHEGRIEVESEPGEGTKFTIVLPTLDA